MNRSLHHAAFAVGLATLGWIGIGYGGSHLLASAVTLLIAAFFLMGAFELHRFQRDTATLGRALAALPDPLPALGPWLQQVPPALQNAVRLRIEGERIGLPGPALAPYLAGLLVLLGMLGTFLGMVVTLNGTGMALDSATDLAAVRASLAAPVKGLGLAFGTSVAGVAASAMLGLMAALSRRERLQVAQVLETRIATTLRGFSRSHQREQTFLLMQQQAQVMPALVERLQAMMAAIEQQGQALNERLLDRQDRFHDKTEAAYGALATSVDHSLKASLADSARIAGATIQPVVEATMAGIARETAALHETLAQTVQRQLDGLSARVEASTTATAGLWHGALAEHRQAGEALSQGLQTALERFTHTFEQRSATLVDHVSARLDDTTGRLSDTWRDALARQQQAAEHLSTDTRQALTTAAASFEQHGAALLRTVAQAHTDQQATLAARDEQRLAAWTDAVTTMAAALQHEWRQAGEQTLRQQQQLGETLAQTARDITTQAEAQARGTIAEIATLMQAAAEAPRAAAEVMGELRQQLSDSLVRDNTVLEERSRLLQTLATLLDAVNHASTEQRAAIDALVASSATLLQQAGTRLAEQAEAQAEQMAAVAAQVTSGAVEVASLGETFGFAVQRFSESNDQLMAQLQRIEGALSQSLSRSDEQLAYYVAQAREVIDLSIMSQKQIVDDLQRLASRPVPAPMPVDSEA